MDAPLLLAALAMGATATPHCALMCGAPCAALSRGGRRQALSFQAGRVLGYAIAGALAASSMAALAAASQAAPVLRPLWVMLQLALLVLGLWWLITGRQPRLLAGGLGHGGDIREGGEGGEGGVSTIRIVGRGQRAVTARRAGLAGLAWVAWPCGVLQGALLLAALASSPPSGALVMALFALASLPGLALAPWLWSRWSQWSQPAGGGGGTAVAQLGALGLRVAGAGLVLASGWALGHGLWTRVAAWCLG
ncbi:MAG: sulfite exporter TauE/SafE family protein [Burkholderiaceae bacterium]